MENQNSVKLGSNSSTHSGTAITPVTFDFSDKSVKTQVINMDDLQRSIRRESGLAGIRSVPVQYWRLYALILTMIENSGFNYDEKEIYVQNNSSKAYLTDEDKAAGYNQKVAPINRWRFDKIISTIQLPAVVEGSEEGIANARNAAIGLTLNKEGLSVAFGMNVWACANFNVLGGTILRSYIAGGREATPWELMEHKLKIWIADINQIWSVQNEIMHTMKSFEIPSNDGIVEEIIGNLYIGAIKQAYFKGDEVPFNTYELSDFVQETLRQKKEQDQLANVWDLYNWGTSIMKPGRVDIGEISNSSNMWSDYLIDEFDLKVPTYEIIEE